MTFPNSFLLGTSFGFARLPGKTKLEGLNSMNEDINKPSDFSNRSAAAARDISKASSEVIESIAQPIVDAVARSSEHAQAIGQKVGEVITEQAARVGRGVRKAYRAIKQSGEKLEEAAQITIRRTPITTILIATGVGVILGYSLGRASRHDSRRHLWG
jgi:ElaB/YqjD/DUF883 family membrane-anchored ribosome-binding protein